MVQMQATDKAQQCEWMREGTIYEIDTYPDENDVGYGAMLIAGTVQ